MSHSGCTLVSQFSTHYHASSVYCHCRALWTLTSLHVIMLTQLHVIVGHADPIVLPASGIQPAGAWPTGHSWCCRAHRQTDWRFRSKLHHRQRRMGESLDLVAYCWPNYMSSHCPISTVPVNKTKGKLCVIVGHTGKWPLNMRLWLGAWLMYICIASVFRITTSL